MATARDHITRALRLIGAVASGETAQASELADGITALNGMLGSWANERLMVNALVREELTLVAGTAQYTVGTGGTFSTTRPQKIERAGLEIQSPSVVEIPMKIITVDEYAAISQKDLQSEIPQMVYLDDAYPLATLSFWPVPSTTNHFVMYSWKPITAIADASDSMSLAPGYDDAVDYNLAVRLAPEYGKSVSQEVANLAMVTKAHIKSMNIKPIYLKSDAAVIPRVTNYNIYTGE